MVSGQRLGEDMVASVAGGVVEVYENARDLLCRGRNADPWEVIDAHGYEHRHVHTEKSRKVPVVGREWFDVQAWVPDLIVSSAAQLLRRNEADVSGTRQYSVLRKTYCYIVYIHTIVCGTPDETNPKVF